MEDRTPQRRGPVAGKPGWGFDFPPKQSLDGAPARRRLLHGQRADKGLLLGVRLHHAESGFDFADPLTEAALDFRHSFTLAQVAGLVEVLEIRAQFQQELLGKPLAHRPLILHWSAPEMQDYPIWRNDLQQVEAIQGVGEMAASRIGVCRLNRSLWTHLIQCLQNLFAERRIGRQEVCTQ